MFPSFHSMCTRLTFYDNRQSVDTSSRLLERLNHHTTTAYEPVENLRGKGDGYGSLVTTTRVAIELIGRLSNLWVACPGDPMPSSRKNLNSYTRPRAPKHLFQEISITVFALINLTVIIE